MKRSILLCCLVFVLVISIFLFPSSSLGAVDSKVYILEDGSIQGTSSIQRDGDVYTLVGDVAGPLCVQRDNILIDGAGCSVVSNKIVGVDLSERHGVTLRNARITLDGGTIIDLSDASDCVLIENTLVGTPVSLYGVPNFGPIAISLLRAQRITIRDNTITNFFEGISIGGSTGHTITGNTITGGIKGISLQGTSGSVFRNNILRNCRFSLDIHGSNECANDFDASNTVDGQPIYYWVNVRDRTVPSDAAYIALVKCTNIRIENSSPDGIKLVSTTDSIVSSANLSGRPGDIIHLLDCSNIQIENSVLHDRGVGMRIVNSSSITISRNKVSNQSSRGIDLINSVNTVISGNTFTYNGYAIANGHESFKEQLASGTVVTSNNFTDNGCGVLVCGEMEILNNVFADNGMGIKFSSDYGNSGSTVTENTFTHNKNALYFSDSSGNSIFLNNFLENGQDVVDAGVVDSSIQPTINKRASGSIQSLTSHVENVNYFPPPPPSTNHYDNGAKGNYWSSYTGSDDNGDGIGDTPYHLYNNNQDNHPLINPVTVSIVTTPIQTPETTPALDEEAHEWGLSQGQQVPIEWILIALATAIAILGLVILHKKRKPKGTPATP